MDTNYLLEAEAKLKKHRADIKGMLWKQIPLTLATFTLIALIVLIIAMVSFRWYHLISLLLAGYSVVLNVQGWQSYFRCRYWLKVMESTHKLMEDLERNTNNPHPYEH